MPPHDLPNNLQTGSENRQCLQSIIEHWVEARIDGPMQAMARYDDAAKLLITIGGFLQAGLVAVYSAIGRREHLFTSRWQIAGVVSFEISLIGFLTLAAWACSLQPEMRSKQISNLLMNALRQCLSEKDLVGEVKSWCEDIESKVERKETLMLGAKILYIFCILIIPVLLIFPLMP